MQKIKSKIPELIKKGLDGRSQRWLCFKTGLNESEFSSRMKGWKLFTQEEIDKINAVLQTNIQLD